MNPLRIWPLLFFCFLFTTCNSGIELDRGNTVVIRLAAEPDRLHPLLSGTAISKQVEMHLFKPLLDFDPATLALSPVLVKDLPEIVSITNGPYQGGVAYTFELRPEAKWDNGTPILAADYVFTVKALLNPEVPAAPYRSYLNFLKEINIDPENPRRLTIITDRPYILAEAALGNMDVYPRYHYDPEGLLEAYTVKQLANPKEAKRLNQTEQKLKQFATAFLQNERTADQPHCVGAGAYFVAEWLPGQKIVLQRKTDWWGDAVTNHPMLLNAHPEKLIFQIIPDVMTAVSLLRAEQIDAISGIPGEAFHQLKNDSNLSQKYAFHNARKLAYDYIGINGNNPRLASRKIRRGLAHLLDVDQLIATALNGLGERVNSPIHPVKPYYHSGLAPIALDLDEATRLIEAAGWKDSDGNGVVDQFIDGEQVELELSFKYNASNPIAVNAGLLLKDNARKIGINVLLDGKTLGTLFKEYRKRDFELIYLSWFRPPILDDLRQGWHTSGHISGGSNRTGFGNAVSDQIIDEIRTSFDPIKRKELYLSIQEMIYNEQPYLFLYSPLECMAIHNRFDAKPSVRHPGIFPNDFVWKEKVLPLD